MKEGTNEKKKKEWKEYLPSDVTNIVTNEDVGLIMKEVITD